MAHPDPLGSSREEEANTKAVSHYQPGIVDAGGNGLRGALQSDDAAAAPFGGDTFPAESAASYRLPNVVYAHRTAGCGARQASQVDDAAIAPLVAHGLHWACAEPAVSPSRQIAAKTASPNAFQYAI
jgi:hypothetical protein